MYHETGCLGHFGIHSVYSKPMDCRHVFCPVFQIFFEATEASAVPIFCKQNSVYLKEKRTRPLPLCCFEYACQHVVGIVCVFSRRKKQRSRRAPRVQLICLTLTC